MDANHSRTSSDAEAASSTGPDGRSRTTPCAHCQAAALAGQACANSGKTCTNPCKG